MANEKLPTEFAPAERAAQEEIMQQAGYFSDLGLFENFLISVPVSVLVLNKDRQAVYANQHALDFFEIEDLDDVLGKRPGELLNCQHAYETPGGCGTTKFCRHCGAAKAILASQSGDDAVHECRILQRELMNALDLRVWARPFYVHGEFFTIFSLMDISDEKRRRALERIFFHDVLNTAGVIQGAVELLPDIEGDTEEEIERMLCRVTERLVDEIKAQRDLASAESGELTLKVASFDSRLFLEDLGTTYAAHEVARGRHVRVAGDAASVMMASDKRLLGRVVGNMVKNALEAVGVDQTVTLTAVLLDDAIQFEVHNPTVMPQKAQLQVFQRSFSTKGAGRGLGTYSIKLLTERYLGGRVSFSSKEGEGTIFRAVCPLHLSD